MRGIYRDRTRCIGGDRAYNEDIPADTHPMQADNARPFAPAAVCGGGTASAFDIRR